MAHLLIQCVSEHRETSPVMQRQEAKKERKITEKTQENKEIQTTHVFFEMYLKYT